MQWSSWSKHVFERDDSYAISCAISRPRKRRVAQMHRAIYNILLPLTGWHLIPFSPPQRVYGRTLRHNQIFSDGWFTQFPYPSLRALRARELRYHRITRKNSAYWQIHTSGLFSYSCLIQVPGCRVTRSADQRRPWLHTRKSWPGSKFCDNFVLA